MCVCLYYSNSHFRERLGTGDRIEPGEAVEAAEATEAAKLG